MINIKKPVWKKYSCILPIQNIVNDNAVYFCENVELIPKKELHITLIGHTLAHKIKEQTTPDQKENLKQFLETYEFSFEASSLYYFLKKKYDNHVRYSRIHIVYMKDKDIFEEKMSQILGFKYIFFPHITTHTYADILSKQEMGIGIQSKEEFEFFRI